MKIPKEYCEFAQPTMIVVTDHNHSKLFLAREREVEHVDTIEAEPERAGDKEAYHQSTSRIGGKLRIDKSTGSEDYDWKEHIAHDHLFVELEENLMKRLQNKEFENLILIVPAEAKNHLAERLHQTLQERITKTVPKNLINNPFPDLVEAVCDKS